MKFNLKKLAVLTFGLGLLFSSCENEESISQEQVINNQNEYNFDEMVKLYGPPVIVQIDGQDTYAFVGSHGEYIVDGDMIMVPDHLKNENEHNKGVGVNIGSGANANLWPNKRIPYVYDQSLSGSPDFNYVKATVNTAMNNIISQTGINFVFTPKTSSDTNVLTISREFGLSNASLGYSSNTIRPNTLKLFNGSNITASSNSLSITVAIHELCHVLGLTHEQNRTDRNDYVTVSTTNANYSPINKSLGRDYGPFDWDSMMLYASSSVMKKKDGSDFMGYDARQQTVLSATDIDALRTMYPLNPAFNDIIGNWAYKEIDFLVKNGAIISGYSDGTFKPNNKITRAEFAAIIAKAFNPAQIPSLSTITFSDVTSDKWYYTAVLKAARGGYLAGSGGLFRPNDFMTREEMITAITGRISIIKNLSTNNVIAPGKYNDINNISSWAIQPIGNGTKHGFVANYPDRKNLFPKINASRDFAAFIIYQGLVKLNDIPTIFNTYAITP